MDRHHDQTRSDPTGTVPAGPRVDEQYAERLAIPGDTRPTVWLLPAPQQLGSLSPQLARLLLNQLTQVGDVVLDVDDDVAFAATAAATGRRHHALAGAQHLAAMSHAAGHIDLILLHWPRSAVNPLWLLRACRSLLDTSGSVVVVTSAEADQRAGHLKALSGVAATAGLHRVMHVAVLDPDAATPSAGSEPERGRRRGHAAGRPGIRRDADRITHPHTDVLIFGVQAASDD